MWRVHHHEERQWAIDIPRFGIKFARPDDQRPFSILVVVLFWLFIAISITYDISPASYKCIINLFRLPIWPVGFQHRVHSLSCLLVVFSQLAEFIYIPRVFLRQFPTTIPNSCFPNTFKPLKTVLNDALRIFILLSNILPLTMSASRFCIKKTSVLKQRKP